MNYNLKNPFSSFWMAGFECSDKLNAFGNRVDLLKTTGHLDLIDDDYKRLHQFNIKTVREGIRWSKVEKVPYQYDWSAVDKMIKAGKANGIQQVWDICHFGFADDLTPLHPKFANRFAMLCRAFVEFYRQQDADSTLIVTPINEASFLSWLGGDAKGTSPYCNNYGWEVKYNLMRAYIEGVHAMRSVDPSVRILTTEPLVQIVPPANPTSEDIRQAALHEEYQYQCTDILCGNICPELGGSPECLDMIGVNFYYNNRWIIGFREFLPWVNTSEDPRWLPLSSMLLKVYERYQRPIVITETSHPGIHRPNWIKYITKECIDVLLLDVPLWGVCIYPIIDRPDWDHENNPWHRSGLWDAEFQINELPKRVLYQPYADALLESQKLLASANQNVISESEVYR